MSNNEIDSFQSKKSLTNSSTHGHILPVLCFCFVQCFNNIEYRLSLGPARGVWYGL